MQPFQTLMPMEPTIQNGFYGNMYSDLSEFYYYAVHDQFWISTLTEVGYSIGLLYLASHPSFRGKFFDITNIEYSFSDLPHKYYELQGDWKHVLIPRELYKAMSRIL